MKSCSKLKFDKTSDKFLKSLMLVEGFVKASFGMERLAFFPAELCELMAQYHFVPSIASQAMFDTIEEWLGGAKKLELLFQASKDGFHIQNFFEKCSKKGN